MRRRRTTNPATAQRRRRTSLTETFLLAVVLLLADDAAAAERRRAGAGRRGASPPAALHSAAVPCPAPSCRCRMTRSGEPIARCRGLPPPSPPAATTAGESTVIYADVIMKGSNVTRLAAGAFVGVRARSLDLSGNALDDAVDDVAFAGLESTLEVLELSNCGLSSIPSTALLRLCRLRILHLDANAITEIPSRLMADCGAALRELYLYRNDIQHVDAEAFVDLGGLDKLSLAENRLETLPAGLFATLRNLTSLDLARNRLHELPDGWLDGLSSLRWLQLDSNRLTEIGAATFRGATALRAMRIENNPLSSIASRAFRPIRRLEYLSIDVSRVEPLTRRTLNGLRRLKTLSLGEIGRSNLRDRVLSGARRLKYLSLSDYAGVLDVNAALRPALFAPRFRFALLSVWMEPMRQCRCSEPWIRALGAVGAYVHGYCADERPLSCRAPGKKTTAQRAVVAKSPNEHRRRAKSTSSVVPPQRHRTD